MKIESPATLPLTLSEVTADTVSILLRRQFPGTDVTALQIGDVIPGTCTKARLHLDYNAAGRAHGLPPTMCMKGGFESHGLTGQLYPREVWFYRHLARQIGGSLPKCYFAGRDDHQAIILMEDLLARNVHFGRASDAASVEQMRSLLEVLAAVHGRFWQSQQLHSLADEPARQSGSVVLDFSNLVLYQPSNFQRMMDLPRAESLPEQLRNLDTARHYLTRLIRAFDEGPRCLIHGDAHLGNTFYPQRGGATGFIDWQTYTSGHWALDVSHLLCTGLTPEVRRGHDKQLIAYYLDQLERHSGPSLDIATAWRSYRRMAFYGFAWALCPPELQAEEVCRVCAERVVTAIAELDTLDALDELHAED